MECPQCKYVMTPFEVDCPRCARIAKTMAAQPIPTGPPPPPQATQMPYYAPPQPQSTPKKSSFALGAMVGVCSLPCIAVLVVCMVLFIMVSSVISGVSHSATAEQARIEAEKAQSQQSPPPAQAETQAATQADPQPQAYAKEMERGTQSHMRTDARRAEAEPQARPQEQPDTVYKQRMPGNQEADVARFAGKVRDVSNELVESVRGNGNDYLRITVSNAWHFQPYQIRLQLAQQLWKLWALIHSPQEPDKSRIEIVDLNGNSVGGSGMFGGSMVSVDRD